MRKVPRGGAPQHPRRCKPSEHNAGGEKYALLCLRGLCVQGPSSERKKSKIHRTKGGSSPYMVPEHERRARVVRYLLWGRVGVVSVCEDV